MKKAVLACVLLFVVFSHLCAQNGFNWTKDQLLEPQALAATLATGKNLPVIFSVGPGATIPHSIHIGTTNESANLDQLKKKVQTLPKTANIVLYCGCCPFEHCPNVRPAMAALKESGFTNYKLLNLPSNLKKDWIDKGYPVVSK